jgi:hypothetical protein
VRSSTLFVLLTLFSSCVHAFGGARDPFQAYPKSVQQAMGLSMRTSVGGERFFTMHRVRAALHTLTEQEVGRSLSTKEVNAVAQLPALKKPVPLENPRYKLAVCAIFRNEARFLKEWIEYYLMMGVEHFYLCNHLSADNYQEVLQHYIDRGVVTLTYETRDGRRFVWHGIQHDYYRSVLEQLKVDTEWVIVCDIDEYFLPLQDDNIVQLLGRYRDHAAVSFNWVMFGTSGVQRIPDGSLMTETLNKCQQSWDRVFKSITRPRYAKNLLAHGPILEPGFSRCDESGKVIWNSLLERTPGRYVLCDENGKVIWDLIPERPPYAHQLPHEPCVARVNHYFLKDGDFFTTKTNRGGRLDYSIECYKKWDEEYSQRYDTTIIDRFVPELRRRMGFDPTTTTAS